jgi:hypothetical protein
MGRRRFEQSMTPQESIKRSLEDSGISDPQEWRKAVDLKPELSDEIKKFKKLLAYVEGEKKVSETEKIKQFGETEDSIERLELLRTMSFRDAIECIQKYSDSEGPYKYLSSRLDFYQKLFQGKAKRKYRTQEWDRKKGEYVDVVREESLDASGVTSETVRLGVLRDLMFAGMIGTPELAIFKIAEKRLKRDGVSREHMPELKGYHSGIDESSVGYAYPFLRDLYQKARKSVEGRFKGQEVEEEVLEHKAVILAANWLEEAMDYNDPGRTQHSPYASGIEEAVAWARLGDERVKAQMRGMRQKIQETNLHNIGRFIGKSGFNKYDPERRKLFWQTKNFDQLIAGDESVFVQPHLQEYAYKLQDLEKDLEDKKITQEEFETRKQELDQWFEEEKTTFLEQENQREVQKQEKWRERETARLQAKLAKRFKEIEDLNLPEEEKELQLSSLQSEFDRDVAAVTQDYSEQVAYFKSRTADQLLSDLKDRQALVETRYEKRKSLAQKALDLHFATNHISSDDDYNRKPLAGIVDWINFVPFGTLKRSHRLMRDGASEEKLIEYALTEIICGERGISKEDMQYVHGLVEKVKSGGWEARQKLESIMKVGNILYRFKYEVSLQEVEELAEKRFYGMTDALREYTLDEVKAFMAKDLDLKSVVKVKKTGEKFGHTLDNDTVAEMAAHNIEGLEDSFRSFDLEGTRILLKEDVNLTVAVAVLNNTTQFGYELSITQIAKIAKNVQDIEDFKSALRSLPLEEVERLFTAGVPFSEFNKVQASLSKKRHASDFDSTLALSEKLSRNHEYETLERAFEVFSLKEVEEILGQRASLSGVLEVGEALKGKSVETDLQEIIRFEKLSGHGWGKGRNVSSSIDKFGIDNVRKMITQGVELPNALNVRRQIERQELNQFDNMDTIIAIAKHGGDVEVVLKTLEAGFSIEEITRFPYLISPLVSKQ